MYPPLCGDGGERCTPLHHLSIGRMYPPKRCAPDRGDSGVSATMWGWGGVWYPSASPSNSASLSPKTVCPGPRGRRCIHRCVGTGASVVPPCTTFPLGVCIPRNGVHQTRGTGVYPPLCGKGSVVPPCMTVPLGVPIPQSGLHQTGGTRVYPPLCGDGRELCTSPAPPSNWASLSPETLCTTPEGLRYIRRYVETGGGVVPPCTTLLVGVPIPQNSLHQTREARVYPPLCGDGGARCNPLHHPPTGCPYPPKRCGPHRGGLGCVRRCVGMGWSVVSPCITLPLGITIPQNCLPQTGGTRVYMLLCGDKGERCTPLQHLSIGRPYPPQRSTGDRGGSGVSAALYPPAPPSHSASLSPKTVCTTTGGLTCICRCVGKGWSVVSPYITFHSASLSPKKVCTTPEGLGCIRRCVETGGKRCTPLHQPPTGRPYPPKRSTPDRGYSGVSVAVCKRREVVYPLHHLPFGCPYPPKRSAPDRGDSGASTTV